MCKKVIKRRAIKKSTFPEKLTQLKEISTNGYHRHPVVFYTGVGLGVFFLARFTIKYYRGHPEIKEFLKDNLDTLEDKFKEYRLAFENLRDEAKEYSKH